MGKVVSIDVVRVFTNSDGEFGNELGIARSSELTRGREQDIAARLGFSETVFIEETVDRAATIGIFTPASELPFAGHPSVGAAWWLAQQGTPVTVLVEKAGDVAVRYEGDLTWISGRASWAPQFEWIPLPTPAAVDSLDPLDFTSGHHYAYAWIDEGSGRLRSRMFAPDMGIAEDEATGAAAVRITGKLGCDLEITQGRGSRIRTRRAPDDIVDVGGHTVFDRQVTI
ncbi:MAG: PhzF family phenazine biosynthesis protein [Actinomycetota bacterium]|nr:PhzF family phenazine biosynthesis protein [Actinomycetota bacterium]